MVYNIDTWHVFPKMYGRGKPHVLSLGATYEPKREQPKSFAVIKCPPKPKAG